MSILKYFYENYLVEIIENVVELGEWVAECMLKALSWILGVILFVTCPFWIIPFKRWDEKNRLQHLEKLKKEL